MQRRENAPGGTVDDRRSRAHAGDDCSGLGSLHLHDLDLLHHVDHIDDPANDVDRAGSVAHICRAGR